MAVAFQLDAFQTDAGEVAFQSDIGFVVGRLIALTGREDTTIRITGRESAHIELTGCESTHIKLTGVE